MEERVKKLESQVSKMLAGQEIITNRQVGFDQRLEMLHSFLKAQRKATLGRNDPEAIRGRALAAMAALRSLIESAEDALAEIEKQKDALRAVNDKKADWPHL
jgi:hypothetical protein